MTPPLLPLTRPGADLPFVLVHLENPAQRVRIVAFSARRGQRIGQAFAADRLPRNAYDVPGAAPSALVTALPLDGTVRRGHRRVPLPDGEYFVRVTVERALRRTPDTGRDLDVTDLPDRPSLAQHAHARARCRRARARARRAS